jgi:hypothetical protein
MANLGGPKGPSDPSAKLGAKILQLRAEKAERTEKLAPSEGAEKAERQEARAAGPADQEGFDPNASRDTVLPAEVEEGARGASFRARLAALGVKGAESLPIKTAGRATGRIKETPVGRIYEGTLRLESPRGLAQLEGVVRITGDLVLQESASKSADLLALRSLIEVGGRLTIEGNGVLGVLDALQGLERARGVYIGFNAGLQKVSLPKLKELEAALIIEGNPALTEISLPSFSKSGRYLHIHDNASLATLSLPMLGALGDELSLMDNPRLVNVKIAARERPASIGVLELKGNAAPSYGQIHVATR